MIKQAMSILDSKRGCRFLHAIVFIVFVSKAFALKVNTTWGYHVPAHVLVLVGVHNELLLLHGQLLLLLSFHGCCEFFCCVVWLVLFFGNHHSKFLFSLLLCLHVLLLSSSLSVNTLVDFREQQT